MTIIYFILVLTVTVMVHELGHFLFAKKNGVYVYEFSIGMGPKLISKKKGETEYSIRMLPIGGYVSMAGEDIESNDKVSKDRQLCNKSIWARFTTMIAGIIFNILLALIILFVIGLIQGSLKNDTVISNVDANYPIYKTNIKKGDKIIKIDNVRVNSYEDIALELTVKSGKNVNMTVMHTNDDIETISVSPIYVERAGKLGYSYGFSLNIEKTKGIISSINYSIKKTCLLIRQMYRILYYLFNGSLSLDNLSGPIGIFSVVDEAGRAGFLNIIYLIAYLCINVAVINLLPFPAFDGGRILFLLIEKIKGSRINPQIENKIHAVGFMILMLLMLFITYHDILKLFIKN